MRRVTSDFKSLRSTTDAPRWYSRSTSSIPGPSIRKIAIRLPLIPRTSTSRSSPPRTRPKAATNRSSVWSTAASRSCIAHGLAEESSARVSWVEGELCSPLIYGPAPGCPPRLHPAPARAFSETLSSENSNLLVCHTPGVSYLMIDISSSMSSRLAPRSALTLTAEEDLCHDHPKSP